MGVVVTQQMYSAHLTEPLISTMAPAPRPEEAREDADAVAAFVRERMEGAASLRVPLTVDIGIGENWRDAKS